MSHAIAKKPCTSTNPSYPVIKRWFLKTSRLNLLVIVAFSWKGSSWEWGGDIFKFWDRRNQAVQFLCVKRKSGLHKTVTHGAMSQSCIFWRMRLGCSAWKTNQVQIYPQIWKPVSWGCTRDKPMGRLLRRSCTLRKKKHREGRGTFSFENMIFRSAKWSFLNHTTKNCTAWV